VKTAPEVHRSPLLTLVADVPSWSATSRRLSTYAWCCARTSGGGSSAASSSAALCSVSWALTTRRSSDFSERAPARDLMALLMSSCRPSSSLLYASGVRAWTEGLADSAGAAAPSPATPLARGSPPVTGGVELQAPTVSAAVASRQVKIRGADTCHTIARFIPPRQSRCGQSSLPRAVRRHVHPVGTGERAEA